MAESHQILESTSSGAIFRTYSGRYQLMLEDFQAGAAWILFARTLGSTDWVDTNTMFRGSGIRRVEMLENVEYRLHGGATGAKAHLFGVAGSQPITIEQIA